MGREDGATPWEILNVWLHFVLQRKAEPSLPSTASMDKSGMDMGNSSGDEGAEGEEDDGEEPEKVSFIISRSFDRHHHKHYSSHVLSHCPKSCLFRVFQNAMNGNIPCSSCAAGLG